jgi:formyltetrahydrofolate deformylase
MTTKDLDNAVLLIWCRDQKGLVAATSDFIYSNGGNILHADQHIDAEGGIFFQRIEWQLDAFAVPRDDIATAFAPIADRFGMRWELHFAGDRPRIAIFVSRLGHCLYDLLLRHRLGEFNAEIPLVVSNHADLRDVSEQFGAEFHVFPITKDTKAEQERQEVALLRERRIDFVVLARYMQVLGEELLQAFPNRIINIHHSFLPAFAGGQPYHRAHERGVKIIGATSHYVTTELDEGPIIEQDVARVSHRDSVDDMIRKGRDLEKIVLARAVDLHLRKRVLVYGNKTVVFD